MLLAVLYCEPDRIAAAAPACDQMALGTQYWSDVFPGKVEIGPESETAYITVNNTKLRHKLLNLGMDDQYDGTELAQELESTFIPSYLKGRAAA